MSSLLLLSVLSFALVSTVDCTPDPKLIADLKVAVRRRSYDASFKYEEGKPYSPIVWSRRAQMSAVAAMVEATEYKDHELIDLLNENADFLIKHTSEAQNIKDRVLNKVVPAWVTGSYSCGIEYSQVVLTGVTLESIAQWILAAIVSPAYCETVECQQLLKSRMQFVERSVALYDNLYKTSGDTGYYTWPTNLVSVMGSCDAQDWAARQGSKLPYNMMISMAVTRHVMWRIYGLDSVLKDDANRARHEAVVKAIAEFFKDALQFVSGTTSYKWLYAPEGRWEDVSHAVSDIRFVVGIVQHGPSGIFSATHLERFGNTFNWITANPDKPYSHVVTDYGAPTTKASTRQSLGSWSILTPWAPQVHNVASYITYSQTDGDSPRSRAYVEQFKPDTALHAYPRLVKRILGEVETPWHAIGPSKFALLTRSSALKLETWDNKAVSSCVAAFFPTKTASLQLRFGHTEILGPNDTIANGNGVSGVFFYSDSTVAPSKMPDVSSWKYKAGSASSKDEKVGDFVLSAYSLNEPHHWFAFCRGGSGHANNNLRLSYFRAVKPPMTTVITSTVKGLTIPPTVMDSGSTLPATASDTVSRDVSGSGDGGDGTTTQPQSNGGDGTTMQSQSNGDDVPVSTTPDETDSLTDGQAALGSRCTTSLMLVVALSFLNLKNK